MIRKPKIALLTVAETRDEFYKKRKSIVDSELASYTANLGEDIEWVITEPVRDISAAMRCADKARSELVDGAILHVPIWASPNLVVRMATLLDCPLLVAGNDREDSSSLVGTLAAAGALGQIGRAAGRVFGNIANEVFQQKIRSFAVAARTVNELRRSSYCILGGRSLGINTTMADFLQWQKLFGIETDHRDQYEIVWRSELVDPARTDIYIEWLRKQGVTFCFNELFTMDSLRKQVNSYIAIKEIIAEGKYDFLGLKCQPEMSDHHVIQCLAIAMLNDTVDADGPKRTIPTSCEADSDGALTMRILSLLAEEAPANLMDIRLLRPEQKEVVFANCGAMPACFSGGPGNSKTSWSGIEMMANTFGKAGGGTTQFVCSPGPVTIARLFRVNGEYVFSWFEGEFDSRSREELRNTTYCWPHGFVKADVDFEKLFQTMGANHMHAVYGHYGAQIEEFCTMTGLRTLRYGTSKGKE